MHPSNGKIHANNKYSSGTDATARNILIITTVTGSTALEAVLVCAHTDSQADTTITVGLFVDGYDPYYTATNVKSCAIAYRSDVQDVTVKQALVTKAATACVASIGANTKTDNVESAVAYDLTFAGTAAGCVKLDHTTLQHSTLKESHSNSLHYQVPPKLLVSIKRLMQLQLLLLLHGTQLLTLVPLLEVTIWPEISTAWLLKRLVMSLQRSHSQLLPSLHQMLQLSLLDSLHSLDSYFINSAEFSFE
jgi:hypothetical protein